MKHEPRVYQFKGNPHFIGSFYQWSAENGRWIRTRKSTECTDETAAMGVVQEWARVARTVGGTGVSLTREKVLASINHILRVAGVPELVESREWKTYAEEWLAQRKRSTFGNTARTYRFRLQGFEEWLGPKRARMMLNQFDGAMLQRFYNSIVDSGRSAGTAKTIVETVGWVFDRAVSEGFATRNPVSMVERREDGVKREKEPFTRDEVNKMIALLKKRQAKELLMREWLTMVYLGMCTGRRLQDCAKAGWQHFETDKAGNVTLWTLRPRKLRRSSKVEKIPIVVPLAGHLKECRKRAAGLFLCPSLTDEGSNLSKQFGGILRAAGVKVGKVEAIGEGGNAFLTKGFHSFRHTLTSWLAAADVERSLRMRIVGHASDKIHEGYTHVEIEAMTAALKKAL